MKLFVIWGDFWDQEKDERKWLDDVTGYNTLNSKHQMFSTPEFVTVGTNSESWSVAIHPRYIYSKIKSIS